MSFLLDNVRRNIKKNIGDGKHKARIEIAFGKMWNKQEHLVLQVLAKDGEYDVALFLNLPFKWNEAGKLVKVLEKLDALPEVNKPINVDKLKNMPVIIEVKNNYKDEIQYSNIVNIERLEEDFEEVENKIEQEDRNKHNFFPKKLIKKTNQRIASDIHNEEELLED